MLLDDGSTSARYRTRRDGAAMWLWRSHNNANAHLAGDSTEDPLHRKVQFPTRQACPRCYASEDVNSTWNEEHILSYLLQYYGASYIIDDDVHDNFNTLGIRKYLVSHSPAHLSRDVCCMVMSTVFLNALRDS